MTWSAIGSSVAGTSHVARNRPCDDAIAYRTVLTAAGETVLICCASDGAGSALHAAWAAGYVTQHAVSRLEAALNGAAGISEPQVYELLEALYDELEAEAQRRETTLNEFSCTLLGCVVEPGSATFFQIGDGAIVRGTGDGFLSLLWWPENGEYQNTTTFLIDDKNFKTLRVKRIDERVDEVALFTDGLQHLALSAEDQSVHQPFFTPMFRMLKLAGNGQQVAQLQQKLEAYLDSAPINSRTDDDKTLFLASRISHDAPGT